MILREGQLGGLLKKASQYSVLYFYSTEEYLARQAARRAVEVLLAGEGGEDATIIEGPSPDIGAVVEAVGMISLFGGRRVVELPLVEPAVMTETDLAALCDLMGSLENAVLILSTVFRDNKAKQAKKAGKLIAAAEQNGIACEIQQPGPADMRRFVLERAGSLGCVMQPEAAAALVERVGDDYFLLSCEVEKLAAASGYSTIDVALVGQMGVQNIDADVFELVRLATARNRGQAFSKLNQLLELQNEPIAIAAALAGSYLDLYRVKCGQASGRNFTAVHKDFGYRGSDWRLKKSAEAAARYSKRQLGKILKILLSLDEKLKSSPADRTVLLQTALSEILEVRP